MEMVLLLHSFNKQNNFSLKGKNYTVYINIWFQLYIHVMLIEDNRCTISFTKMYVIYISAT